MDTEMLEQVMDLAIAYGLKVVGAIVVLFVAYLASKIVSRTLRNRLKKTSLDATLAKFFVATAGWLILLIGLVAALELFGVKTTSFVALLGAAGLAVGLAFQGTLSNFAAGVMLLVFRPFKVGDVIDVSDKIGTVDEIGLFTTSLDTLDNRRVIIPNSGIFGSTITNITFHPRRRVDVSVGTEYRADLQRVRTVLEGAAARVEGRLDEPAPQVFLAQFGDSSIDWKIRVWAPTKEYWPVYERIVQSVKAALDEAGIGIPFPQMDVHLDGSLSD